MSEQIMGTLINVIDSLKATAAALKEATKKSKDLTVEISNLQVVNQNQYEIIGLRDKQIDSQDSEIRQLEIKLESHGGQDASRKHFKLEAMVHLFSESEVMGRILDTYPTKKMSAIKWWRSYTGKGLTECKEDMDAVYITHHHGSDRESGTTTYESVKERMETGDVASKGEAWNPIG